MKLSQKLDCILICPHICCELEDDFNVCSRVHNIVETLLDYVKDVVDIELKDFGLILPQDDWKILCKVICAVVIKEALDACRWFTFVRWNFILLKDFSEEQYCWIGIHVWNDLFWYQYFLKHVIVEIPGTSEEIHAFVWPLSLHTSSLKFQFSNVVEADELLQSSCTQPIWNVEGLYPELLAVLTIVHLILFPHCIF